jgi:hypothetical protein
MDSFFRATFEPGSRGDVPYSRLHILVIRPELKLSFYQHKIAFSSHLRIAKVDINHNDVTPFVELEHGQFKAFLRINSAGIWVLKSCPFLTVVAI